MTNRRVCNNNNMTAATRGAVSAYPFEVTAFSAGLSPVRVARSLV
jgi:hypothetical protein